MKITFTVLLLTVVLIFFNCKKATVEKPEPQPIPSVSALYWEKLTFGGPPNFNGANYFSTIDTSIKAPIYEEEAKLKADKIDIVYFFELNYAKPGFMGTQTASKLWYWDYVYKPWLSVGIPTKYYLTKLSKSHFDSAKSDVSKFTEYFSDSSKVKAAPHRIYPYGTCIGGREICLDYNDCSASDISLYKERVYGFTSNGKKGMIYIRKEQPIAWPIPQGPNVTYVDIIKER
jgi:hypothetical protein